MGGTLHLSNLAIVRASPRKRLWVAAAGVAVFLATVWTSHAVMSPSSPQSRGFGLDFIAFYTAGDFVREGQSSKLYNLPAVRDFQRHLAAANHFDLGHAYGPWWNPPFYALVFAPFSLIAYPAATLLWLGMNLACFVAACVLLCRWLPSGMNWRSWSLLPILTILSAPFILAVSHAQNTCTSLLLLAATVTLWRSARPLLAGLVGGLMFYKPQVAALFALMLVLDLGWRALVGYAITGSVLLGTNLIALPGTLTDYLHRLPQNVHSFQTQTIYPWEQHVTLKAFGRLLEQGHAMGDTTMLVTTLTVAGAGSIGLFLLRAAAKLQRTKTGPHRRWNDLSYPIHRDRLIAATIAATPLLMPFYFDYDLLLLAVPAALFASEMISRGEKPLPRLDRWAIAVWSVLYAWQMINTDVAEKTHVNVSVLILCGLASLLIARVGRADEMVERSHGDWPPAMLPKAA